MFISTQSLDRAMQSFAKKSWQNCSAPPLVSQKRPEALPCANTPILPRWAAVQEVKPLRSGSLCLSVLGCAAPAEDCGSLVVQPFWIGCTTVSTVSVWVSSSSARIICSGGPCQLTFSLFADKNYQQGMNCDWNWDAELLYRLSVRHGCFVYKCLSSLGLTLLLFE